MKDLRPVTMYKCGHCKKLFKTDHKHNCRRDPDKHNCYSCLFWNHQFYIEYGNGETTCDFRDACAKYETSSAEGAHDIMSENGWHLACMDYAHTR
jgi:hypothetical protein